jgi:outer membrane protein assembly factor BamB
MARAQFNFEARGRMERNKSTFSFPFSCFPLSPPLHLFFVLLQLSFVFSSVNAGENWPQFRGPTGDGHSDATGLPLRWSETENVKWKTAIHGRGWSSPVIWDDQIWMTTATQDGHEQYVVCVDRNSGKIVHDVHLFHNDTLQITNPLNSFASPTPVIEAGRVYVHFGVYGTACLDTQSGRVLWQRRDIYCDHFRGPGSSPILVDDLLIFHMDGIDVQFVIALDRKTGKTVWRTNRSTDFGTRDGDFRKAYTTPIVIDFGGRRQMISVGAVEAMSYDPATGKELWKVRYNGYSEAARPLFGFGLVFMNTGSGSEQVWAVRPDGVGDVTATHVAWKFHKNVSRRSSPILVDDLIYMVSDDGIATCVEAKTGKLVWQQRMGGQFSASPLAADGRIYLFSHEGPATVIAPGRKYQRLAVNRLDEGFMASPAVSGQAIFLRNKTDLYRIEK